MKWIKLLTAARVNGVLRHPHEGVLHLEDGEAQRLLDDEAGKDVSADFTGAAAKDAPVESLTADTPQGDAGEGHPHQSNAASAADDKPAARRKAAAEKE
jgi:hypothetical protein